MAVTEACANCVLHAYDGDAAGATYSLEAHAERGGMFVIVRDSGLGMPDLRSRDRPTKSGAGVGLRIINRLTTSTEITSPPAGGTLVSMRFTV